MAVKISPVALEFIQKNLNSKETMRFSELVDSQKNNPVDIKLFFAEIFHLSNPDVVQEGILAKVKDKKFYSVEYRSIIPIFRKNPIIKMMEVASKYANKKAQIAKTLKINI